MFQCIHDSYETMFRTAKSVIDAENNQFILRSTKYPEKGGTEWIVSGNTLTVNTIKRNQTISESFFLEGITSMDLKISSGNFCTINLYNKAPKWWNRGMNFSLLDVFVGYALAQHVLALQKNDDSTSFRVFIDPSIIEMRQKLDIGTMDESHMKLLREKGSLDAIGFVEQPQEQQMIDRGTGFQKTTNE